MKKCPFCAEEIHEDALKCRFCGEILVEGQWREFCERFARLSQREQERERANLSPEQREVFEAAWKLLNPSRAENSGAETAAAPQSPPSPPTVSKGRGKGKASHPVLAGCLLVILLIVFIALIGRLDLGGDGGGSVSPGRQAAPLSPEEKARQTESAYQAGVAALEKGKYEAAERWFSDVLKRQRDYKDINELISRPEIKKVQEERERKRRLRSLRAVYAKRTANVRGGPGTDYPIVRQAREGEALKYETLRGEWYKLGTLSGEPEWIHQSVVLTESEKRLRESADLQLISWQWGVKYGYATAEGRVKNVSSRSLENVEVVVEWYTNSGDFVTSSDCLVEYNPILRGQTSPFKCSATANPAMRKATINFKTLFGSKLVFFTE